MDVNAEFHFDFGSPNAYLAHLVLPSIERRTGVRFGYVPVLLGGVFKATGNVSPAVSNAGVKNKGEYGALEMRRFLARHGITRFSMNPFFPVNTLAIMRGAVAAKRVGCFERYVDEVYRHMWADPKKMDDAEVKQELLANTERSVARGTFGSPSFYVGDELFFGKDRLREVEEEIEVQKRGR